MSGNQVIKPTVHLDSYYEWCIEKMRQRLREAQGTGGDLSILMAAHDSLLAQVNVEITGSHKSDVAYKKLTAALREPVIERWRVLYRALAWMVNDYIGVCDHEVDFTKNDKRLGYAHEGYHNARIVMNENRPPVPERLQRFNEGTGCFYGGNSHPDRCVCQDKETGRYAGTPHKHYDEPPYMCARCGCKAYKPRLPV